MPRSRSSPASDRPACPVERLEQRRLAVVDVPRGADNHPAAALHLQLRRAAPATPRRRPVAAQVQPQGVVVDAPEHRNRQGSKRRRPARASDRPRSRFGRSGRRHQRRARQAAPPARLPLPIMPERRHRADASRPAPSACASAGCRRSAWARMWACARVSRRSARQALGRAGPGRGTAQHRFQRGQRQLVDRATHACSGFFLILRDQVLAADDQPGLRPAQQLVAAEGDDVGAVEPGAWGTVGFGRQAPAGQVHQACRCRGLRAAAGRVGAPVAPARPSAPGR